MTGPDARRGRDRAWPVLVAVGLGVLLLLLAGCAAQTDEAARLSGAPLAGFWWGLWQGLILPITFVVSLFDDQVAIYEVHNDGALYDLGYVLGVAVIFSGPARLGGRSR